MLASYYATNCGWSRGSRGFGSRPPYVRFGGYDYRLLQRILEEAPIDDDLKDRIAYRNITELIRQFNLDWQLPAGRRRPRASTKPTSCGRWTRRSSTR